MAIESLKRNTIHRLKEIKDEQQLSIAQIMDMMEKRGQYVSEATLKKLFAKGSEEKKFRYQDSIAPVADVLLDIYGDKSGLEDVASLKQIIREKNRYIELLVCKLEEVESEAEERKELYQDRKQAYETTIASLENQVQRLNSQIDKKDILLEKLMDAVLPTEKKDDA